MARFNGGTLEDLFDDSTPQTRAAVCAKIDAASVAADGDALAFEAHADEMDAEADRDADICDGCGCVVTDNVGDFFTREDGMIVVCADCAQFDDTPNPAPNMFACNWHELVEAQADPTLVAFADDWDLMVDRSRAIMARTLPAPETILARLLTRRNKKAAGKAAQAVVEGVRIRREGDALIVASQSEARDWTVTARGCNCRATGACWHGEMFAVTVRWEAER